MPQVSGAKFIGRNRPRTPRIHIEYTLELYNAERKVELPFVMGVMADLSGKPAEPLPSVADRRFDEIDVDNFNDRLKALKPRVAFTVPNVLSGEHNLAVELTFESLDDFAPDAVARQLEPLRELLESRERLDRILSLMDGKPRAEQFLNRLLKDKSLREMLAGAAKPPAADGTSGQSQEHE